MILTRKYYPNTEDLVGIGEEERTFAESRGDEIKNLLNLVEGNAMEIMKAIEFYKLGGEGPMIDHWISIANGRLHKTDYGDDSTVRFHMGFIGALNKKDITTMLSEGDYQTISGKYSTPEKFIEAVKNKLSKQTNKGEEKYEDWITKDNEGFLVSNEDYVTYFKFITLCLAGVIEESDYLSWQILSNGYKFNKMVVPKAPIYKLNKEQTKGILRNCIDKIIVNVPYPDYRKKIKSSGIR